MGKVVNIALWRFKKHVEEWVKYFERRGTIQPTFTVLSRRDWQAVKKWAREYDEKHGLADRRSSKRSDTS